MRHDRPSLRPFVGFLFLLTACLAACDANPLPELGADEPVAAATAAVIGAATCADQHRVARALGGETRCGACIADYAEAADRTCQPVKTCAELGCAAQHQLCDLLPTPACAEACEPGYLFDEDLGTCRLVKTCATLECGDGHTCVEATDSTDATCTTDACDAGQGRDALGACGACTGGQAPTCGGPGETGGVLRVAGDRCVCETRAGYFVSTGNAGSAEPCDADGDGWVNDGAQPALEGDDPALRANARCRLRHVSKFVLQNEDGDSNAATAEDLTTRFGAPGLPLYESARNDGREQAALPQPYGLVHAGKAINSLTKACVDASADFDDNRIADVSQGALSPAATTVAGRVGANATLAAYYGAYVRYSYFLELASGWYERGAAAGAPGVYRIQERRRVSDVGLRYPDATPSYWQECRRGTDVTYAGAAPSRVGGDFTLPDLHPPATGMGHESQFKCVVVYDASRYPADYNEASHPEAFYVDATSGKLTRRDALTATVTHALEAVANECSASAELAAPRGVPSVNPVRVAVSCALRAAFASGAASGTPVARASWALVSSYAYSGTTYQRGCVDQCQSADTACGAASVCDSTTGARTCTCQSGYTALPAEASLSLRHSGACVAVGADGVARQAACTGGNEQKWALETTPMGYQRYRNKATGKCLGIEGGSFSAGARIVAATCSTGGDQRWRAIAVDGVPQAYQLQAAGHSGLCMRAEQGSAATGTAIVQGECTGETYGQMIVSGAGACNPIDLCPFDNGSCGAGYTCRTTGAGQRACDDNDECASNNGGCGNPSVTYCRNTSGSYYCEDRNECAESASTCGGGQCTNLSPGYDCNYCGTPGICGSGYSCRETGMTYACDDINECAWAVCPYAGERCYNTPGSYYCDCPPRTHRDINGACVDNPPPGHCECGKNSQGCRPCPDRPFLL